MDRPAPHGSSSAQQQPKRRPVRDTVPLCGRKIFKKSIGKIVSVLLFGVIAAYALPWGREVLFQHYAEAPTTMFVQHYQGITRGLAVLLGLLLLYAPFYQSLYYRTYFYDIDDKSVVIRKGVIAKREATLPFKSITDVYVDQDFLDVLLGLYDLHISTPTKESGLFSHVDGLNKIGAAALKQRILDCVQKTS